MKVSELTAPELDLWVARACGVEATLSERGPIVRSPSLPVDDGMGRYIEDENWMRGQWLGYPFRPSVDWVDGGPMIYRFGVVLGPSKARKGQWMVSCEDSGGWFYSPSPLISACRAIVASVFGEEVNDEESNQCES